MAMSCSSVPFSVPYLKNVYGEQAMVASGNPLAALAAQDMLMRGGSAVDAAIAADAVMGVVEPMATSIGGDLLAMLYLPEGKVISYNGTGRSPQGLLPERVQALPAGRIPERHPLSVTVPGAVQGWHDLHTAYGRLPWPMLFEHAITHARSGFQVAPVSAREWAIFAHVLRTDAYCARLYQADAPPKAGDTCSNPELANLLEQIAQQGPQAFYQGWVPQAAAHAVQAHGGVLAARDFHTHTGYFCEPVSAMFHGYTVHQCPPNTHGVAVLTALQDIEAYGGEPDAASTWVHLVQATSRAMKQAAQTVQDPAGNTVCTVVVDTDGLAMTLMSSIFKRFGCGIAVPGAGFVLQNRGFGFAAPGGINGAGPGRRPYHTVVPGITTYQGQFCLGMGVVGGLMQPQGQIQILTRVLAWNHDLEQALNAPRMRLEAHDTLAIEQGTSPGLVQALRTAGYAEPPVTAGELAGRSDFGGAHAVLRRADGRLQGVADPRKDGIALAVNFH